MDRGKRAKERRRKIAEDHEEQRSPKEQLDWLDEMGYKAEKERIKLKRKIEEQNE